MRGGFSGGLGNYYILFYYIVNYISTGGKDTDRLTGRNREMLMLEDQFRTPGSSLAVVYGRKRSGKTSLLMQFMRRHPNSLYFLARKESSSRNLAYFRRAAADFLGRGLRAASDGDWNRTFREIADLKGSQKTVIMMDEFHRIGQKDPSFPSVLQYAWDTVLKNANVMLILCGSSVPQMSAQVLEYGSPLYGRRSAQILLGPLTFSESRTLSEDADPKDAVLKYSVTGGVPKYIGTFAGYGDVYSAIEDTVLNPDSYLFGEVMSSLRSEVADAGSYAAILGSIASGHTRLKDMAEDLGLRQTGLTSYLKVLTEAGLAERKVPVTEDDPLRSKKGVYGIPDRMAAFWFRYVYPHLDLVERRETEKIMGFIRADLPRETMASAYRSICAEKMAEMSSEGYWDFAVDRIGGYWDRDVSADLVGTDRTGRPLVAAACVCTDGPAGPEVLEGLRAAAGRMSPSGKVRFAVFSLSGFRGEWPSDTDLIEGI